MATKPAVWTICVSLCLVLFHAGEWVINLQPYIDRIVLVHVSKTEILNVIKSSSPRPKLCMVWENDLLVFDNRLV